MPAPLRFTAAGWASLQEQARRAYPFEGCGLLLGPFGADKIVEDVVVLENMLRREGRGRFDFTFSPKEFVDAQRSAEKRNFDILGIYHTHPDHPPVPSATDAGQPMLSGWINVIAAVHGGHFKEAKAWWREDEMQPFIETPFTID